MSQSRNNAPNTRGRPFARGNPGRPKGTKNKASLVAQALLEGEAEALSRKAVELALAGDVTALRLCLERLLPPRKDRPVTLDLPRIEKAADALSTSAALIDAAASGEVTPSEATQLARLVEVHVCAIEVYELEQRLAKLEAEDASRR